MTINTSVSNINKLQEEDLIGASIFKNWRHKWVVQSKSCENLSPKIKLFLKEAENDIARDNQSFKTNKVITTNILALYTSSTFEGASRNSQTFKRILNLQTNLEQEERKALKDASATLCNRLVSFDSKDANALDRANTVSLKYKELSKIDQKSQVPLKREILSLIYDNPTTKNPTFAQDYRLENHLNDEIFVEELWKLMSNQLFIHEATTPLFKDLIQQETIMLLDLSNKEMEQAQSIFLASKKQETLTVNLENGEKVTVPGDFFDSIKRTLFHQISNKQNALQMSGNLSLDETKERDEYLKKQAQDFLKDLKEKLGEERNHLLLPLLKSIEQASLSYITLKLRRESDLIFKIAKEGTSKSIKITIPQDEKQPVVVSITCDYDRKLESIDSDSSTSCVKFSSTELRGTLKLTFGMPEKASEKVNDPLQYCQRLTLEVSKRDGFIQNDEYPIEVV